MSCRKSLGLRDMDEIPFDVGSQGRFHGFGCDQVNPGAQELLQLELQSHEGTEASPPLEGHQHIDIAAWSCLVPRHGAEDGKLLNAKALPEPRQGLMKNLQHFLAVHGEPLVHCGLDPSSGKTQSAP